MLYVDESIQNELGYICIGFAFCENDPTPLVENALIQSGFDPIQDEYKSSYKMNSSDSASKHQLREAISSIVLEHCKIGVYIASSRERRELLQHIENCSRLIVRNNKLQTPQLVFIDEGIHGLEICDEEIIIKHNQDSKKTCGIQLADYIAYHCSLLLKSNLLEFSKKVLVNGPHPLENEMVELDWLTRTALRRNFFHEYRDIEKIEGDYWMFQIKNYGFFFSPNLDSNIKEIAEDTFNEMYFGCVW